MHGWRLSPRGRQGSAPLKVFSFAQSQGALKRKTRKVLVGRQQVTSAAEATEGFLSKRRNVQASFLNTQHRRMTASPNKRSTNSETELPFSEHLLFTLHFIFVHPGGFPQLPGERKTFSSGFQDEGR